MVKLVKEIVDTVVSVVPQAGIIEDVPVVGDLIDQSDSPQSASPSQTNDSSQEDEAEQDVKLVKEIVDTVMSPVQQFMDELTDELPEVISSGLGTVLGEEGSSNTLNQNQETGGDEDDFLGAGMPSPETTGEADPDEDESLDLPSFSPIP
ncbi:hypothetical protein [Legionella tunisiensis]|uniref:hypothetical protein n=1 Tax=Legionella tunisiensis TaxID=1034944 RepID=UPI00059438D9|nr:hypothetical protein [Legionella tunisiensis]